MRRKRAFPGADYFSRGDFLVLALLLILSGTVTCLSSTWLTGKGGYAVVIVDGETVARLNLDDVGRQIDVTGPIGTTRIQVTPEGAQIIDSACPYHTCVRMGAVNQVGRMVICVPNRVVVRIEGDDNNRIDGVTG